MIMRAEQRSYDGGPSGLKVPNKPECQIALVYLGSFSTKQTVELFGFPDPNIRRNADKFLQKGSNGKFYRVSPKKVLMWFQTG